MYYVCSIPGDRLSVQNCSTEKIRPDQTRPDQTRLWQSVAASDSLWQPVTVCGILWQSVVVCGSLWQSFAVCSSLCKSMAVCGSLWRFVAPYCSLWQSFPNLKAMLRPLRWTSEGWCLPDVRRPTDYPFCIFSVSFVFLNSLVFCLVSTVLWSGATSICDGIISFIEWQNNPNYDNLSRNVYIYLSKREGGRWGGGGSTVSVSLAAFSVV